jgi:hypothetical protein
MNVSYYGHRCRNMDDIALAHQQLLCFLADLAHEGLSQELLPQQCLDARVEIKGPPCPSVSVCLCNEETGAHMAGPRAWRAVSSRFVLL